MKSSRSTHATVRDASRIWGRPTQVPTLSEDGTLWHLSRFREHKALRFRHRTSLKELGRATGRQVLSLLRLW